MSKKTLFAVAAAIFLLGGSQVFSDTTSCTPSRADVLGANLSQVASASPSCTPSRTNILTAQSERQRPQ